MFYWEQAVPNPSYMPANVITAVANAAWIAYDSRNSKTFGVAWGLAWIIFVALQWPLLGTKHPGLYLALAISSRAVAIFVRNRIK
jgi:hypothetical protein